MRTGSRLLLTTVLAAGLALPASGQMMGPMGPGQPMGPGGAMGQGGPMGPMGGGMMGGQMGGGPMGSGVMGQPTGRGSREGRRDSALSHEGPLISIMLDNKQELGLNPEQEKKLRELRANFEKESVQIGAQIRMTEIDLGMLLEQDRWDLGGIEPKIRQIANLQGELHLRRLKTLEAGRATLSPEQLEKFKQIGHRMRAMGGPGRPMGAAGPMGPTQPRGPGGSMPPGQPMGPGMPGPGGPPAPRY